jgi:hypothetical protein
VMRWLEAALGWELSCEQFPSVGSSHEKRFHACVAKIRWCEILYPFRDWMALDLGSLPGSIL